MVPGISLANKCQLLFGFAVLLILSAALSVPWFRVRTLVVEGQVEPARLLADAWYDNAVALGELPVEERMLQSVEQWIEEIKVEARLLDEEENPGETSPAATGPAPSLRVVVIRTDQITTAQQPEHFLELAVERFFKNPDLEEYFDSIEVDGLMVYRYVRPLRESQIRATHDPALSSFANEPFDPAVADPLRAILLIDRTSAFAEGQLLLSRVFILTSGIVASLLAVLVFYLILTKLILSPVRQLRRTTEKVQAGDLTLRSTIQTGDEFEQLSEAFNAMMDQVQASEAQLRTMNENLDLKVSGLEEANIGLFESNRLKSEFIANVSHELRTPLNSIIGFAELLDEFARDDPAADPKRTRYIANILDSGRSLLEMINELLDMAKIEAGRVELTIEPTSVVDLSEGLLAILKPQASAANIELKTDLGKNLPLIETDRGKLQQILYNFLSNAIKFSPRGDSVVISAERLIDQDKHLIVRLAVTDHGPGIPYDMQDTIFEKFRQVDASHTREHAGTGLGLAICRELAVMLGATVSLISKPGYGSTFHVDLPLTFQPNQPKPLMA